uniref:Uncharacterized protein n=1 Tax=Rhizophora mucronata TaxID=61149 RepID=A0A2P2NU63_RHIMU
MFNPKNTIELKLIEISYPDITSIAIFSAFIEGLKKPRANIYTCKQTHQPFNHLNHSIKGTYTIKD